jgi:hypothetical protein
MYNPRSTYITLNEVKSLLPKQPNEVLARKRTH